MSGALSHVPCGGRVHPLAEHVAVHEAGHAVAMLSMSERGLIAVEIFHDDPHRENLPGRAEPALLGAKRLQLGKTTAGPARYAPLQTLISLMAGPAAEEILLGCVPPRSYEAHFKDWYWEFLGDDTDEFDGSLDPASVGLPTSAGATYEDYVKRTCGEAAEYGRKFVQRHEQAVRQIADRLGAPGRVCGAELAQLVAVPAEEFNELKGLAPWPLCAATSEYCRAASCGHPAGGSSHCMPCAGCWAP